MGADYEAMVVNLMGLGFSREEVVRALKASFNNPDRAADYLFNGIPESALRASGQAVGGGGGGGGGSGGASPAAPAVAAAPSGAAGASAAAASAAQIAQLAAAAQGGDDEDEPMPQLGPGDFAQLSQVLQQQPALIPIIMQQIQRSNPQLYQLVQNNPQALIQLLSAIGQQGGAGGAAAMLAGAGGGAGVVGGGGGGVGGGGDGAGGGGGGGGGGAGGARRIAITPEEKQSLDNLEALGFSRQKALEAFLLCDRNEELAANYLFDHAGDDMLDERGGGGGGGGGGAS